MLLGLLEPTANSQGLMELNARRFDPKLRFPIVVLDLGWWVWRWRESCIRGWWCYKSVWARVRSMVGFGFRTGVGFRALAWLGGWNTIWVEVRILAWIGFRVCYGIGSRVWNLVWWGEGGDGAGLGFERVFCLGRRVLILVLEMGSGLGLACRFGLGLGFGWVVVGLLLT